jgi:ElaB/YqjD/DUF883 family membrane-anchored ribosome-binding protein
MAPPNEAGPQAAMPTATKTTTKIPDANSLKRDVDAVVSEVQDLGAKVSTEAQEQVSQLADQAQAKIAETAEKVKGVAGEQKDLLADRITGVAEAADRVATDLESNNQQAAQYVRMVADNAGKLSDTIRNNDVDQIVNLTQDFGRQQPVAFLGAAALLGFVASRFIAASAQRSVSANRSTQNGATRTGYSPLSGTTGTGMDGA